MVNLTKDVLLRHYKRKEIQEIIVQEARGKEIGVCFGLHRFGKRPDVLQYPKDVLELAKRGVTSFHCSEETWSNPLQLGPGLRRADLNELRTGWDLILDIDCKYLEYSKIATDLIVSALRHHNITSFSVKFSGNHGFHIGIPFKAFPEAINGQETRLLFPEGPKKIAAYLQEMIREHLAKRLLAADSLSTLSKNTVKSISDIMKNNIFDPFTIVDIDTILISSRHLYRMPYSFNEKSGLVSIPVDPDKILEFNIKDAEYQNIKVFEKFITKKTKPNDARQLFVQAFDFNIKEDEPVFKERKEFKGSEETIPEEYFPPCLNLISKGLVDGKKRALFILINFLGSCGWKHEDIKKYVYSWNERNPEPLKEVYLVGQLRYNKLGKKVRLPPNCKNISYYKDLQICLPDGFCKRIKNPANYAIFKQKIANEHPRRKKSTKKGEKVKTAEKENNSAKTEKIIHKEELAEKVGKTDT